MNAVTSPAAGSRAYAWLAAIMAATFVVHLVFSLYYVTHNNGGLRTTMTLQLRDAAFLRVFPGWDTDGEGDAAFYNRLALGVIETGIPRNHSGAVSLYAPVYSYFMAACYIIAGVRQLSVSVPQALLAALITGCLGLTARRLAPQAGGKVMLLTAALVLVNLRLAMYASSISPTLLLLLWFALALYLATFPLTSGKALGLAGAVSLGIFTQAGFFVVGAAVALWLMGQAMCQRRLAPAVGSSLILLCIGGRLMVTATAARVEPQRRENSLTVLWEANNPYYESMTPTSLWERRPGNPWTHWRPSEQEQQRYDHYIARADGDPGRAGFLWVSENPMQYAKLCWVRLYTTLGPFTGMMSPRNRAISTFYWLLIFPAGYYGWWRTRHLEISRLALLVFLALTTFATLVITEWYLRYRFPVDLIMTIYAGVTYAGFMAHTTNPQAAGMPLPARS